MNIRKSRLPIDLLNGGTVVGEWVDDLSQGQEELEKILEPDEKTWREERKPFVVCR